MINALLESPTGYDALTVAVAHDGLRAAALTAVRALLVREIDAGRAWPGEAASWLSRARADWQTSAVLCNDLAWYARIRHQSALLHLTGTDHLTRPGTDRIHARALSHLHLVSLRFDFRCRTISGLLDQVPREPRGRFDPYTRALGTFALLGRSRPEALEAMERDLAADGDNLHVCHALLHGLWLGDDLPDQAEHLLRLGAWPTFDDHDPIMLFRSAGALRALGRRDEALQAIDDALDALAPDQPEAHADLVRERALITQLP